MNATVIRSIGICLFQWLTLHSALSGPVTALVFHPELNEVWFNEHGRLIALSLSGEDPRRSVVCDTGWESLTDCRFDSSGLLCAVSGGFPGRSGGIKILEANGRRILSETDWAGAELTTAVGWNRDGTTLVVSGFDSVIRTFKIDPQGGIISQGDLQLELTDHARAVLDAAFSPDESVLVSAGVDRSLKVWDPQSGDLIRSFSNHTGLIFDLAFRPARFFNGNPLTIYCATASDDLTVRIWQPGIGRMVRIIRHHAGPVFSLVWHPDGNRLYSAGQEGVVREIDGDSDRILRQWQAHDDWIYELAIDREGKRLATGAWTGEIRIWDLTDPLGTED